MPRSREGHLLTLFLPSEIKWDDDTTTDPPEIVDLETMANLLRKAQQVLEGYQITVHSHMPRQLTPLNLEQIQKKEWAEEPDGASE